jgi:hypothetical protein
VEPTATALRLAKEGRIYGAGGARAPLDGSTPDTRRERGWGEDHVGRGVNGWPPGGDPPPPDLPSCQAGMELLGHPR